MPRADNQRDHSRTDLNRSKEMGTAIARTNPTAMGTVLPFHCAIRAIAKPTRKENAAICQRRTDSFTRGPKALLVASIAVATKAGTKSTIKTKTDTSSEVIFAAENTVVFFPYKSSIG